MYSNIYRVAWSDPPFQQTLEVHGCSEKHLVCGFDLIRPAKPERIFCNFRSPSAGISR